MRKSISISVSLMPDVLAMLDELTVQQHSSRSKCIADLIRYVSETGVKHGYQTKEQQSEQS